MGRYRRKREAKARRRPWEFSKKLAAWAVLVATAAAVASYVLAFRDQQTASDVTTTMENHRKTGICRYLDGQ